MCEFLFLGELSVFLGELHTMLHANLCRVLWILLFQIFSHIRIFHTFHTSENIRDFAGENVGIFFTQNVMPLFCVKFWGSRVERNLRKCVECKIHIFDSHILDAHAPCL